jgi:hypothetical protein
MVRCNPPTYDKVDGEQINHEFWKLEIWNLKYELFVAGPAISKANVSWKRLCGLSMIGWGGLGPTCSWSRFSLQSMEFSFFGASLSSLKQRLWLATPSGRGTISILTTYMAIDNFVDFSRVMYRNWQINTYKRLRWTILCSNLVVVLHIGLCVSWHEGSTNRVQICQRNTQREFWVVVGGTLRVHTWSNPILIVPLRLIRSNKFIYSRLDQSFDATQIHHNIYDSQPEPDTQTGRKNFYAWLERSSFVNFVFVFFFSFYFFVFDFMLSHLIAKKREI